MKYSNIVKSEKNREEIYYKCKICEFYKQDKIWMKYIIGNNKYINICSYLCSKKHFENKEFKLDKVVNKTDFDLIRPVNTVTNYNFKILSINEIELLTNTEYNQYFIDLDNYVNLNPERAKLQLDIQTESDIVDNYTNNIR